MIYATCVNEHQKDNNVDLMTTLLVENCNIGYDIMSHIITESSNNKLVEIFQNAIKWIKETADRFRKWFMQKINDLKEKVNNLILKIKNRKSNNKDNSNSDSTTTTNSDSDNQQNNRNVKLEPMRLTNSNVELWTEYLDINDLMSDPIEYDEVFTNNDMNRRVYNSDPSEYEQRLVRLFNRLNHCNIESLDSVNIDELIEKKSIPYDRQKITDIVKKQSSSIAELNNVRQTYDKRTNDYIVSLQKAEANLSRLRQPNVKSVSYNDNNVQLTNKRSDMHDDKAKLKKIMELFKIENKVYIKLTTIKIQAIMQCMQHNTSLLV